MVTGVMMIGSVLAVLFLLILFSSAKRYQNMVEPLNEEDYRFHELYTFGFAMMNLLKYKFSSKVELKRRQCCAVLYGEKYADYYLQVIYAQKMTLTVLFFILGFAVTGMAGDVSIFFVFAVMSWAVWTSYGQAPDKKVAKRSEELLNAFPDVVSKIALLTNASMTIKDAWKKVSETDDGILYEEMRIVVEDINNGMSEIDAYFKFGSRCMIPEIKKFTSTIAQGVIRGNRELAILITQQSKEVWDIKMNIVKQQGAKANTKLLLPMLIMFIGIIIMVVVPIFTNLGV